MFDLISELLSSSQKPIRVQLQVAEKTDLARIVTKANVFQLITEGNVCVGCVYKKGGQDFKEFGPVILASGRMSSAVLPS